MKKLAVVGAGSAGIQSLCHFLSWLDNDWTIISIHNPNIPILGIGESTNPTLIAALERGLNFDIIDDLKYLDATHKFGTKIINWRQHSFVNPLISGSVAIHFDTFKLKDFAFDRMREIWKNKFQEIHGNVTDIFNSENDAHVIVDGVDYSFDYVMDCRGFPKEYTKDYTVIENNPVNYGLVHNIEKTGSDWKYTYHTATKDGWMFSLPLQSRESYGYMFNNNITDIETAKKNFSQEINVPVDELQNIEYKFQSYYTNRLIDGRIIKNGNSAVFFEPMFANSLWLYDQANRRCFDYINDNNQDYNNSLFVEKAKSAHDMISFYYHGGSIYDTEFWKYATKISCNSLSNSEIFKNVTQKMRMCASKQVCDSNILWVFQDHNLRIIDKNFGYNYFSVDN